MFVFLCLICIGLVAAVLMYNAFVRQNALVREAWSGIDVLLKRRYELIPNLVATVKDYKAFESGTLEKVTQMRNQATHAEGAAARGEAEKGVAGALAHVFVLAENYPDLKANETYKKLQEQLVEVEDQLQYARRYYNGAVRDMNIKVQSFPSNLIAKSFGFKEAEYFQLESDAERSVPKVGL